MLHQEMASTDFLTLTSVSGSLCIQEVAPRKFVDLLVGETFRGIPR
jgi:hypothetical protein